MKKIKYLFVLCLFNVVVNSQSNLEIGILTGYSNYLGDLVVPAMTLRQSSLAVGLVGHQQLTPCFALRANLIYGRLKGSDQNYDRNTGRNNHFKSSLVEFTLLWEYDLLGNRRFEDENGFREILSPYFFFGFGLIALHQTLHYGHSNNPDVFADYAPIQPSFPFGMGLKKDISQRWNVSVEWGMRLTLSDYLDGVKWSGDPSDNDVYFIGGILVSYHFEQLFEYKNKKEKRFILN